MDWKKVIASLRTQSDDANQNRHEIAARYGSELSPYHQRTADQHRTVANICEAFATALEAGEDASHDPAR